MWSELTTTGDIPSVRASHSFTSAQSINRFIGFGGETPACQNDSYLFDPSTNTWTLLSPGIQPASRYEHVAVWDQTSVSYERLIIHGGRCGSTTGFSDTWELSLQTLTPTATLTTTPSGTWFSPTVSATPTISYTPTASATPTISYTSPGSLTPTPSPTSTSTVTVTPTLRPLCDTRYPTLFTDIGGGATDETQAFACDFLFASIPDFDN